MEQTIGDSIGGQYPLKIDSDYRTTSRRWPDVVLPLCISGILIAYWGALQSNTIRQVPLYLGEMKALSEVNWLTMWTWTDYGGYYRYSPTALLAFGLFDRYVIAPMLGISFPSPEFTSAGRLVPVYVTAISVIAFITYRFCRYLLLDRWSSTIAAVFFGFNKGFAYFFVFASTIATFLLILYGFGVLYFAIQSVRNGRRHDLFGYYAMLLLSVGTWEQWVNWLAFLVPAAFVLALAADRPRRRRVALHGILMPLVIAVMYLSLRFPTIHKESSSVSEAQYLLSYPSISMKAEDVVVNASLHIASIVEPLLFPWPMLSQSVIRNYNMDTFNPYNRVYTPFSTIHYRGFGDWYAGLIFGLFTCATAVLIVHAYRQRQHAANVGIGLGLTYAGFVAHLPIMYRTYFVLPGYVSLLDYKHPLSIMGFSFLVGWAASRVVERLRDWRWRLAFTVAVCGWLVFCNYSKIAIAYRFQLGAFPW